MSVNKLLSRINASSSDSDTYGITADPLTHFACAFSALIHDLDHSGVSNAVLVEEESALALKYKGRSVAEQNSLDLAWVLLMEPRFKELRAVMFANQEEARRVYDQIYGSKLRKLYNETVKIKEKNISYDDFVKLAEKKRK